MTEHKMRTHPLAFQGILTGKRVLLAREQEQHLQVGDVILLQEWNPAQCKNGSSGLTGRWLRFTIQQVTPDVGPMDPTLAGFVGVGLGRCLGGEVE